ncbi:hypothetical protein [Promicromonospora kroppenstedtii]|uniref:hypothetical protein n=1 Tax=Promicromonospora kroppenstedtii TaxID=440482 RepID=UPI000561461E|nr:hypothetical protein [Promicromonospora kroppenstedtii]
MTTLIANLDTRTLSGKVLPFGEIGYTNVGAVMASAESDLSWPDTVSLNREHDGDTFKCGTGALEKRDDGIYASFSVDEGAHGDVVLLEASEGKRNAFSIEIPSPVIRASKIVSGVINAVAAVVKPAFKSALMAADAGELADLPDWLQPAESTTDETEDIVIDGVTYTRKTTRTNKTTVEVKEGANVPTDNKIDETDNAKVDLTAAFGEWAKANLNKDDKAPALTAAKAFKTLAQGEDLHAALASVTHDDGDNDGDGVGEISAPQGWLGEVYKKTTKPRKFSTLIASGDLTHYREVGYKVTGEPTVADYAGNLAEVPTGSMTVAPVNYTAERVAHGANVDRRYFDFNDSTAIQSFTEAQIRSYDKVMDAKALAFIIASGETETAGEYVPGIARAIQGVVDGALALIGDDLTPTGAVIGLDLWRAVMLTPKDQVTEYLSSAFGLEDGEFGGFRMVPTSAAGLAGKVAVLDGSTLRLKELGGGAPVRVEAEYASNGGRTLAVFGYYSEQELEEGGVRIVTPAAPPVEAP